jgi:hypothetical protein
MFVVQDQGFIKPARGLVSAWIYRVSHGVFHGKKVVWNVLSESGQS